MNYIVYKTTNLINGKIYVGVHRTNPDIFDGYIGCGVTKKDKKKKVEKGFPVAVRKYGYENFKRETLFIYPDSEEGMEQAYKKEEEIVNIDFIKSSNTYNLVVGGKHSIYEGHRKVICQYTLDGIFIRTWDSIQDASDSLQLNYSAIQGNISGKTKSSGNFQWKLYAGNTDDIEPVQPKQKTVYQFDLQGNLIKVWKSASEAAKTFSNPNAHRKAICATCNGQQSEAYGYYWSYKCKFDPKPNNHLKAVAKYDDDGNFIESYSTIKEAAESLGLKSSGNIIAAIKGTQKRCGGYRWRYFYGNTNNINPLKDKDIV